MSDTLVVYIWTNMPCPVGFHRHSDILILVTSSIILAGYSFYIHLYAFSSSLPRLEVFPPNFSFWLVGSTTISSSSSEWRVPAAPCCSYLPFPFPPSIRFRPPSTWHLCPDGCQFQTLKWSVHVLSFQKTKLLPPFLLHTFCFRFLNVSNYSISYLYRTPHSPVPNLIPPWMLRVPIIYFCLLPRLSVSSAVLTLAGVWRTCVPPPY